MKSHPTNGPSIRGSFDARAFALLFALLCIACKGEQKQALPPADPEASAAQEWYGCRGVPF